MLLTKKRSISFRAAARASCGACMLLLLWQLVIGALIAGEAAAGFTSSAGLCVDPAGLRSVPTPPTVPSSVPFTQIWRDTNLSSYSLGSERADAWRAFCSDPASGCSYSLYTDADIEALLAQPHYAWFRETYAALAPGVRRADAARLLVLHALGGVYADLDTKPSGLARELLALAASHDYDCVLPLSPGGRGASNFFLACGAGSPFLAHALASLRTRALAQGWWRWLPSLPYLDVLAQTGPVFISGALRSYAIAVARPGAAPVRACVAVASSDLAGSWVNHATGRSWHGADGHALLLLEESGTLEAITQPHVLALAMLTVSVAVVAALAHRCGWVGERRRGPCHYVCGSCCWQGPLAASAAASRNTM